MDGSACSSLALPQFCLGDGSSLDSGVSFGSRRPVVIFESGVGGLTVAKHILKLMPNTDLLYVADNLWFPYGSKPGSAIARRVKLLFDELRLLVNPQAIVVACNTASVAISNAGSAAEKGDCIRISPPVVEAAHLSLSKKIVILATSSTLENSAIKDAIAAERQHAAVWPIASQIMVGLAEMKLAGGQVEVYKLAELVSKHLSDEERKSVDTVLLGCTHFPHLVEELRQVFPAALNWVDPAYHVALELQARIEHQTSHTERPARLAAFTSVEGVREYSQVFLDNGFNQTKLSYKQHRAMVMME
ncbi:glutamate racemase [Pseudomonas akapageensis]|uniref:glutamate racemase n=1 Tax=Pseudomonas akapageensis TaxID=2609961 RepID=UPI0014089012|nr:glutamate racemase [Pseudomonas akapageensis]